MDSEIHHKTAFVTHNGVYEWTRMSFGLKYSNDPSDGHGTGPQRAQLETCLSYIDDIQVFSNNFKDHEAHVQQILPIPL